MACHIVFGLAMNTTLQTQGASLDDTLLNKFKVVIPDQIKFKTSKQALQARRLPIKQRSEQQTYASNNNKQIKIKLPNNALYDTRYGYLSFTMSATATGGTYCRVASGADSVFDRLLIRFGAADVEDIMDYNRIKSILWETEVVPDVSANFSSTSAKGGMGIGTQAERNVLSAGADYSIPIVSGILNGELLPFQSVRNGMELNFYIADPTTCVETDGTNPVITITNVVFHIERLDLDQKYLSFIATYIAANGLQIGFHSWERYTSTLGTGAQQNLLINNRSSSVSGLFNLFLKSDELNNTLISDRFLNWIPLALSQYSMLINGNTFPDEPIDALTNGGWEAYQIYLRYVTKWKLNARIPISPSIPFEYFTNDRFLFIVDLEAYPEEEGLINPFTTLGNNATTILKLVFNAPIASGYQCDTWIKYFKQVAIYSDGSARVIQ